jgi:hypothetical protein
MNKVVSIADPAAAKAVETAEATNRLLEVTEQLNLAKRRRSELHAKMARHENDFAGIGADVRDAQAAQAEAAKELGHALTRQAVGDQVENLEALWARDQETRDAVTATMQAATRESRAHSLIATGLQSQAMALEVEISQLAAQHRELALPVAQAELNDALDAYLKLGKKVAKAWYNVIEASDAVACISGVDPSIHGPLGPQHRLLPGFIGQPGNILMDPVIAEQSSPMRTRLACLMYDMYSAPLTKTAAVHDTPSGLHARGHTQYSN